LQLHAVTQAFLFSFCGLSDGRAQTSNRHSVLDCATSVHIIESLLDSVDGRQNVLPSNAMQWLLKK